ncbi:MAG: polyprenyl synthetase family protein [Alphaproteobacteria bacterium]|jgi:octaprenyl-diphosphate synthase|nr:polyprenyl synthetase family protein [Alphaproteobacteria bacterium]
MSTNFSDIASQIKNTLLPELQSVNEIILDKMQNKVELIPQIASHIVASGGKRIRPILTLLSAKLFNYHKDNHHVLLASCIEFIHTATLLHDDVVDENNSRRGKATSNNIWGNKASVLVGDFLFTKSFELMVQVESLSILEVLSNASSVIAQGEVMQLANINNVDITFNDYEEIIFAKTASLFAAATKVGAMLSGTSKENIENIYKYGVNLGIVFQIMDDILDYSSSELTLGKGIGTDFKEGKITLPILLTLKECNDSEREFLNKVFSDLNQDDGDFEKVLELIEKYNIIEKSVEVANSYVKQGLENLESIDVSNNYKDMFKNLLVSSTIREN